MDLLPLHFGTLQFFGLWNEPKRQENHLVKYIWKPFIIIVIVSFTIMQLAALKHYSSNIQELSECIFLSMTYLGSCVKLLNFLYRPDVLDELLNEFRQDICRQRNIREINTTMRYKKIISIFFYSYMSIAQLSGFVNYLLPLLSMARGDDKLFLPYKTYELCDINNNLWCFWLTYVFQLIAIVISIFVTVTLDIMLGGFILLTCCQIDLCCDRFTMSRNYQIKKSTKELIEHQLLIGKISRKLELFFMRVLLPLMLFSLITLCTSIFNMSQIKFGEAALFFHLVYFVAMLCQLLSYCWPGTELKLKSNAIRETIYNSDWTKMKSKDKKSLYFIMLSCQKDQCLSFHELFTISLDMFVWVIKTAYAAYNILKTVDAKYG